MFEGLKSFFDGGDSTLEGWNIVEETATVERILQASKERPQLIYKHSNRCSTCLFTKSELEQVFEDIQDQAEMHFVDVIRNRSASDSIAEQLGIRHESPQAILLDKGKVIWHASHSGIKGREVLQALP